MPRYYGSPRWSYELPDCSMPMTFDQYSMCAYNCDYCFAKNQRTAVARGRYQRREVAPVRIERVKAIFTDPDCSQFGEYIKQRYVLQWGGLADPFCEYERRYGVGLELLRFFREIAYPISFSTKGVWWLDDPRYRECFEGFPWFHVKISIITADERAAKLIERGAPTPQERLDAIGKAAALVGGGVTLRHRPYIIGVTDKTSDDVIAEAARRGAMSVSSEFFCAETRSVSLHGGYPRISKAAGFDVMAFYKLHSGGGGYMRLNREIKRPFVERMQAACDRAGIPLFVSDQHFKEVFPGGSCCGLPPEWPYSRGQYTEALVRCRETGQVHWLDIAEDIQAFGANVGWGNAAGYNQSGSEKRAKFYDFSFYDWLHYQWNHPNEAHSPYKMFGGMMRPAGLDENGDVIYEYDDTRA